MWTCIHILLHMTHTHKWQKKKMGRGICGDYSVVKSTGCCCKASGVQFPVPTTACNSRAEWYSTLFWPLTVLHTHGTQSHIHINTHKLQVVGSLANSMIRGFLRGRYNKHSSPSNNRKEEKSDARSERTHWGEFKRWTLYNLHHLFKFLPHLLTS